MNIFKTDPRAAETKALAALRAAEAKRDALIVQRADDESGVTAARADLQTAILARAAADAAVEDAKAKADTAAWTSIADELNGAVPKDFLASASKLAAIYQRAADAGLLEASYAAEFCRAAGAIGETNVMVAQVASVFAKQSHPFVKPSPAPVAAPQVEIPATHTVFLTKHAQWIDGHGKLCKNQNVELPAAIAQYALRNKHAIGVNDPTAKMIRSSHYTQRVPSVGECVSLTPDREFSEAKHAAYEAAQNTANPGYKPAPDPRFETINRGPPRIMNIKPKPAMSASASRKMEPDDNE